MSSRQTNTGKPPPTTARSKESVQRRRTARTAVEHAAELVAEKKRRAHQRRRRANGARATTSPQGQGAPHSPAAEHRTTGRQNAERMGDSPTIAQHNRASPLAAGNDRANR